MTELEKIKILFQASVNNEQVIITLQDNTQLTGAIQSFDGSTVSVDGNSVGIDSIMSISLSSKYENQGDSETNKLEEYVKYKGKNIKVSYKDRDLIVTITAYVFDVVQKTVVLLTSSQKLLVDISTISDISVIYDDETTDKPEQDNPIPTEPNAFEKAILDADQSTVTHYLENPESLKALGYTDTEINYALYQIKTPLPWNDVDAAKKPYNQARRIFTYERNRNQIAKNLFNEYISSSYVVPKYKVKAISSLIEILEVDSSEELVAFCEKNADYITRNSELCLKAALALLKNNQLDEVEKLVEHLPKDIDSSELMLVLNFYKEHPNYDFSKLPGLDALSRDVSFKELLWIKGLPSKQSFIQLLFLYEKYNRFDKFFGLLNLFMPEARNDQKTVELVRKCLEKTDDISNLLKYLPEFPLLWLDKDLVASFVNSFPAEKELSQKEQHLMNHAKRVEKYRTPNRLEESVIKANPQIFEVLRSNEGILKEMDYSADEILSIKEVDIDGIRFGKKPIAEKIYEFQGNKNYTAEMVSGREFLYYPERISRILFPLLIEEKCGDLVYELYNYSPYIRTQLYHEKRYYINALLILNEKDIFWNETRDSWMTLKADDPALEELFKIALEKNEHAIADAVKLYSKKTPFNELENALITGNVSGYRTIATDAVLLSSLGYSTEEIQLVQSLLKQRVDFTAHDNLSIANRIYLAQKNKNQSAELFYQLAVKDSPVLASSGLFSIYENEGRYQDLCNVYENYYSCLPGHNPKEHGEQYLYSLYHTAQYQKLYEYWRENPDLKPDRLIIINSMMQLLLPDEQLDVLFREPIDVNEGNNNLAKECIIFLLSRTESPIIWDFLTRVYNLTFPYITAEEFADIKARFKFVGNKELACSGGLIALTEASDEETILSEWYKYLMQLFSDAAVKISITENIIEYYMCNGNSLKDSIQTTVLQLQESGVDIPQKIMQYIYSHIESDHDKILWLDEHLRQSSDISSPTFKIYLRFAQDLNSRQHVVDLLDKLSKRDISFVEDYIQACFYYLDEEDQNKNIAMILRCILQFSKDRVFTSAELEALYTAYTKLGNTSFAFFAQYALHNTFSTLSTDIRSEIENETQTIMGEQSLYTATKEVLSSESINDIDAVITLWGRYFKISDDDTANITILKDYYNEPSKWTKESIDSLIIHLIVFPSVPLYWRLLRLHFAEESDTIKCCIDYHLAIAEKASLLPILTEAINNGFETQSIAIATRILSSMDMSNIQNSVLAIRSLTNNKFEWIQKHNTTLIDGICHNRKIYSDIKTESIAVETAMEIAFDGNNEEYFYNAFQAELNSNMLGINLKFLCNLILHSPEKINLIAFSKTTILNGGEQLPYFNVISDLLLREVSSFTNEDKGILELISSNRENVTVKRFSVSSFPGPVRSTASVFPEIHL